MSDDIGVIHGASNGGVSGKHGPPEPLRVLVAPSRSKEFNTVRHRLIPVACWRVDDIRFEFGSSFVTPEIEAELKHLAGLVKDHPGCPLSVFGHADPVGSDDYNKGLSGRRAMAIYGMLTRSTSLWEHLYSQPFGGDHWGSKSIRTMQAATGLPVGTSHKDLFRAYMERLCGNDLKLSKNDFLAHGVDVGGKGDYQGCGEFNPLLIFSQNDNAKFQRAPDKTERNAANAPNRRVMVLLFRKGSRIDPARWPCPRATEGVAGCRNRFWSDGERRRSMRLPQASREFSKTEDTFACRFYQRLTSGSPCESVLSSFLVRLYDPDGRFIAAAPCKITINNRPPYNDRADDMGIVTLRSIETPSPCTIEWGFQPKQDEAPQLPFSLNMLLVGDEPNQDQEARKKLNNLGYCDSVLKVNVESFQSDYGDLANPQLSPTGQLDQETMELLRKVYQRCADDLRHSKP